MGGLLVIMGSGETAPTMVKPHRAIFERIGDAPALLLDTPYGFQENADDITAKAIAYFAASVGRPVSALSWRTTPPPGLARDPRWPGSTRPAGSSRGRAAPPTRCGSGRTRRYPRRWPGRWSAAGARASPEIGR